MIAPTPAKHKINSTFDNGTPTPRKIHSQPRLNLSTPVGEPFSTSFATSTIYRRPVNQMNQMSLLEESDEMSEFGSLSDISSINGGPSTSSVISAVSKSMSQANVSVVVDPAVLSPYLRKFAEQVIC
jgi:hypothetical protein